MASAQAAASAAKGLQNVQQYNNERPLRDARLNEAKLRQKQAGQQLQEYENNAPRRQSETELAILQNQAMTQQLYAETLATNTDNAFTAYETDGDARHLNNFLAKAKKNPAGQSIWSHWVRLDPLVRNPTSEAALGQIGITDLDEYFANPELVKSKIIGTDATGKQTVLDMNKLYQATGYTQRAEAKRLGVLQQRAEIEQLMRGTQSAEGNMITQIKEEKEGRTWQEAMDIYYQSKNQGKTTGSAKERVAQQLMDEGKAPDLESAMVMASDIMSNPTATSKDLASSDDIRAQIDEVAGGDFMSADMNDPKLRSTLSPLITKLERFTKAELTQEDARVVREMRSLIHLGGSASESITDDEAGPIDHMLKGFKKYLVNEVDDGVVGTAAYSTFRNVLRHAISGASLTGAEITSYTEAAGSLYQQAGPVLAQLGMQLEDVREKLQTVYDMNDETIAQYRLGASREKIDSIIEALDERVEFFRTMQSRKARKDQLKFSPTVIKQAPADPAARKAELDKLFSGDAK